MAILPSLPDSARVWIHSARAPLTEQTQRTVINQLEVFIDGWQSHERDVRGGTTILYDRFILLAGTLEDGGTPSGCAIDDATRAVQDIAGTLDIEWVPSLHVLYRASDDTIEAVPRHTFQERVDAGDITGNTTVFDASVTTLGGVRHGDFEQQAAQSWHADAFSIPTPAETNTNPA